MNTANLTVGASYTSGYAKGRHAASEHVDVSENPFRSGSSAFHGWNDGHYDERSARKVVIDRHSVELWSNAGAN